jgi:hypothetical protein
VTDDFKAELPAGGSIPLQNAEELDMWQRASARFQEDYAITKPNDLVLLGALLTQQLLMYRAQIKVVDPEDTKPAEHQNRIMKAGEEIRKIEKSLGIDKQSREAGGQHNVAEYITKLKKFARAKGIRISERVVEMESLMMDMSWKIRLLRNGDDEDRRHHGITDASIVNELEKRIDEIHEKDQEWAREVGSVFVGQV